MSVVAEFPKLDLVSNGEHRNDISFAGHVPIYLLLSIKIHLLKLFTSSCNPLIKTITIIIKKILHLRARGANLTMNQPAQKKCFAKATGAHKELKEQNINTSFDVLHSLLKLVSSVISLNIHIRMLSKIINSFYYYPNYVITQGYATYNSISPLDRQKCSICSQITNHPDYDTIFELFQSQLFYSIKKFLSNNDFMSQYADLSIQFDCNNNSFCVSNLVHQRRHKENPIITATLSPHQFVLHSSYTKDHIIYTPRNPKNITAGIIHSNLSKYFAANVVLCAGFVPPQGITRTTHSGVFDTAQFLPTDRVTNVDCEIIANKAPNKKLCNKCHRSNRTFENHAIKRQQQPPSKFVPYCKLSTIEQAQKYRAKVTELNLTKRKYNRLKKEFESRDTIIIRNASTNEHVHELLTYLSNNIDKLNEALIDQPLLLSFIQDQLKATLQDHKV